MISPFLSKPAHGISPALITLALTTVAIAVTNPKHPQPIPGGERETCTFPSQKSINSDRYVYSFTKYHLFEWNASFLQSTTAMQSTPSYLSFLTHHTNDPGIYITFTQPGRNQMLQNDQPYH
ncbi:hypothetical protein K493DRAFT_37852 [Basidiobolus meristosporus CBS 931.73]|uniref:Uncharacterized protein n=1 Tax=Basidiobolus meristosporus CBS 931.73 TaxID=1314790 RepID=A0A1Y1Y5F5_9FUNG|nr:hypothetical protein K493DRAFT_37852 [Basidiobolus meristosporus CBS 931.73]|eukprot:ORX93189.1 hypothetical protein K493DRAFT_37852 [Basidiobolus meristosporus CBS 931.73]